MRMTRRADRPLVLTIVFAVAITAALGAILPPRGSRCVNLVVASSLEKAAILKQAADDFNAKTRNDGGACAQVSIEPIASGSAEQALLSDWRSQPGERPDVWSPAATAWLLLSYQHRRLKGLSPVVETSAPSLFESPLVVAMPDVMARALGWPDRALGWSELYQLARDPSGWALYGHPEWGAFRLGKTNPEISTSGLHALLATYFAASGKASDLSDRDLADPRTLEFVRGVESAVVHYGDTAFTFLTNLRAADQREASLAYASAVAVEEKEVWNYNRGNVTGDPALGPSSLPPRVPLAAVYPREGTLFADHPFAVLNASWVTTEKRRTAERFLSFLLSDPSQRRFQGEGFRDRLGRAGPEISPAQGLDPAKPATVLRLPSPSILAAALASWNALRRGSRIALIVDESASVGNQALAAVRTPVIDSLAQLRGDDEAGLWATPGPGGLSELVAIGPMDSTRGQLRSRIQGLATQGKAAPLADSIEAALARMAGPEFDRSRIQAIVLISDGRGVDSARLDLLLRRLQAQPPDRQVRVFTVAYGSHPDAVTLNRIAVASGGALYEAGSAGAFHDLLQSVLSNF